MEEVFSYRNPAALPAAVITALIMSAFSLFFNQFDTMYSLIGFAASFIISNAIYMSFGTMYGNCSADEELIYISCGLKKVTIQISEIRSVHTYIRKNHEGRKIYFECILDITTCSDRYSFSEYLDIGDTIPDDLLSDDRHNIALNKLKIYIENITEGQQIIL